MFCKYPSHGFMISLKSIILGQRKFLLDATGEDTPMSKSLADAIKIDSGIHGCQWSEVGT